MYNKIMEDKMIILNNDETKLIRGGLSSVELEEDPWSEDEGITQPIRAEDPWDVDEDPWDAD